jgi:hypothetical protein
MKVKRFPYRIDQGLPARITGLLRYLGLNYRSKQNRRESWWSKHEHQLYEILVDCKQAHRRLVKQYHPDLPYGDGKVCAFLNAVFQRIVKLFYRKGITICD